MAWADAGDAPRAAPTALAAALESLTEALAPQAPRGRGLENCHKRSDELQSSLRGFLGNDADSREVAWVETRGQGFALRLTPLDVAEHFRRSRARHGQSWVLTSATLGVNGSFEHFQRRLGIDSAQTLQLDSPFDYARNTRLYLPASLPEPRAPGFDEAYLRAVEPVLEASEGRAFMLFTSHRALRHAADWLRARGWSALMVQGDAAPKQLLERFRATTGAVLLGTQSFWEGVDVRGPALSCVMIDRLPFASPGDPVLQARAAWLKDQGRSPFADHQLPEAIIGLRQGVGRLIRDTADRGVLVLGDTRIVSKPYGRLFRASLPPMPLIRDIEAVNDFFADQSSTSS